MQINNNIKRCYKTKPQGAEKSILGGRVQGDVLGPRQYTSAGVGPESLIKYEGSGNSKLFLH